MLECRGMNTSRPKTQYMDCQFEPREEDQAGSVNITGEDLEKASSFNYLVSMVAEDGNSGMETKWIGSGRNECSGVLCDRKVPLKLKGRIYKTVVRTLCYIVRKLCQHQRKRTRNWIQMRCGCRLWIMCWQERNQCITESVMIVEASKKVAKKLNWFGHLM